MIPSLSTLIDESARVPGWFEPVDVAMFWACGKAQTEQGVHGNVVEIGTYLGKSAVVLGSLLGADEWLTVCDVFQEDVAVGKLSRDEWLSHYASLTREQFERNYRRVHEHLPVIRQMSSADLGGVEEPHSFRFVHVDGSHLYEQVRLDLQLAINLACERAIIVFDDITRSSTPGVASAVWPAVEAQLIVPIAMTRNKLYALARRDEPLVHAFDRQLRTLSGLRLQRQPVAGGEVVIVEDAPDTDISSGKRRTTRHLIRRCAPPALIDALRPIRRLRLRR